MGWKSLEFAGHWPLWWGWKNEWPCRMGTVERQKSGVKIQLAGLRWRLDNPLWQI